MHCRFQSMESYHLHLLLKYIRLDCIQDDEFHGRLVSSLYLCRLPKSRFAAAIDNYPHSARLVEKSTQNELRLLLLIRSLADGLFPSTCGAVAGRHCRRRFREVQRFFDVVSRANSAGLRPGYYYFGLKAEKRRTFPCARIPYPAMVLWVSPASPRTYPYNKRGSLPLWVPRGPQAGSLPCIFRISVPVGRENEPFHRRTPVRARRTVGLFGFAG